MKIRNKIFLSILVVAVIPLVVVLFYVESIYSQNYDINIAENRQLAKEGVNSALESFLGKLEWISNDYFVQDVQNILSEEMYSISEQLAYETQLNTISTIKLDLCEITDSVDQIWVKTRSDVFLRVNRNYTSGVDLNIDQIPEIASTYKNHMIYRYQENGEETSMLVYSRDIKEISNPGIYLATIYICFDEDIFFESYGAYCETFSSEISIKNSLGDIIYQSENLQNIENIEENSDYRKDVVTLENFGLEITFYENAQMEREPVIALKNTVIIVLILSCIVVFLISIIISSSLVKPITGLTRQVNRIEQGDYLATVKISGSRELETLGIAFNNMGAKIHTLINEGYKREIAKNEAVIASLTEQINPHFLYNTLDMMKSMAELEDMYELSEIIKAMAHTYRYATKTNQLLVSVEEEVAHLDNYMRIMQVRFGEKIKFTIEVESECNQNQMIKLCLQPLVENAIAHGRVIGERTLEIHVHIGEIDNHMAICVTDTGKGMDEDILHSLNHALEVGTPPQSTNHKEHCGVGLHNINQRIKLYYGEEFCVKVESEKNIETKVWIDFPVVRM